MWPRSASCIQGSQSAAPTCAARSSAARASTSAAARASSRCATSWLARSALSRSSSAVRAAMPERRASAACSASAARFLACRNGVSSKQHTGNMRHCLCSHPWLLYVCMGLPQGPWCARQRVASRGRADRGPSVPAPAAGPALSRAPPQAAGTSWPSPSAAPEPRPPARQQRQGREPGAVACSTRRCVGGQVAPILLLPLLVMPLSTCTVGATSPHLLQQLPRLLQLHVPAGQLLSHLGNLQRREEA